MAATASASNVFWLGCAVDTRCGSVVSILDSPAAAHRKLRLVVRELVDFFSLDSPTATYLGKEEVYAWCVLLWLRQTSDDCSASIVIDMQVP